MKKLIIATLTAFFLLSSCKKEERYFYYNYIHLANHSKIPISYLFFDKEYSDMPYYFSVEPDSSYQFEILQSFYQSPMQQLIDEYDSIKIIIQDTSKQWDIVRFYHDSLKHYTQNLFNDDAVWIQTSKQTKFDQNKTILITEYKYYTFAFDTLKIN